MENEITSTKLSGIRAKFPLLKDRETVLSEIQNSEKLRNWFENLKTDEDRNRFLDICTGARGLRMTYDGYFKYIFDTELHRDRLEALISVILGQKVKIKEVLPLESICVGSDKSIVIMDIVVELEDGSIANVEMQKHGYSFPGERAACYSADLLLRQYKRVKDTAQDDGNQKKRFVYKDIKPVYTIVFYEKSPKAFHEMNQQAHFIHHAECKADTGVKLNLLQHFFFIPLDIFRTLYENKIADTELAAWLMFLSTDNPEAICRLIEAYPCFEAIYRDIYELTADIEGVMNLFSKELQELDEGTTQYMIDELTDEVNELKGRTTELEGRTTELEGENVMLKGRTTKLEGENTELKGENTELKDENASLRAVNKENERKLKKLEAELAKRGIKIASLM